MHYLSRFYTHTHTQKSTFARTNITEKNPTKTKQVVESFLYKLGVTSKWQFQ